MSAAQKNQCRMQKLNPDKMGKYRMDMLSVLGGSLDPFASVIYNIDIGPCRQFAKDMSAENGLKISLTHVVNKLLALAIAENPIYNQTVLGGSLYQMEDICITNVLLLPGPEQALSSLVLVNPHLKSLPEIQQEFKFLRDVRIRDYHRGRSFFATLMMRLFFKFRLYRLIPEKVALNIAVQKGLSSNIILSNHMYSGPAKFLVAKPMLTPMKVALKIHSCGMMKQPVVVNDSVVIKEIMPFNVITDHRVLHGVHAHDFGVSLERIAADPGEYMR